MDVKSFTIKLYPYKVTLSPSKDDMWAVMLYTNANGACLSGTERKRLRQEKDRWVEPGRGGSLWKLFRENLPEFTCGMILDSGY